MRELLTPESLKTEKKIFRTSNQGEKLKSFLNPPFL